MYVWIWRHLPGPIGVKLLQTLMLLLVVVAFLMLVVFPIVEPHLPISQVTVPGE